MKEFTAETTTPESQNRAFRGPRARRRGDRLDLQKGEFGSCASVAPPQISTNVILTEPELLRGRVEGSPERVQRTNRGMEFSRKRLEAVWKVPSVSGSFDSAPMLIFSGLSFFKRSAQDDRSGTEKVASRVLRGASRMWAIVGAALREIFDENAYERFLARTRAVRSIESYREFCREREGTNIARPRCC